MNIFRYCSENHAFILIDGRNISTERFRKPSTAKMLCAVNETEAIVILESDPGCDFRMSVAGGEDSTGVTGTADAGVADAGVTDAEVADAGVAEAGDRARACAVAFADLLGLKPRGGAFTYGTAAPSKTFTFIDAGPGAGDAARLFSAEVLTHFGESKIISLNGQPGLETICEGEL